MLQINFYHHRKREQSVLGVLRITKRYSSRARDEERVTRVTREINSERASLLTIHHDMPVNWRVILYLSYISSGHSLLLSSHFIHLYPPTTFYSLVFPFSPSSLSCLSDSCFPANVVCVGYSICRRKKWALDFPFDTVCVSCPLCWRTQNGQSMKRLFRSDQRQRGWDRKRVLPEEDGRGKKGRKTIDSSVGQKWVEGRMKIECPILIKSSLFPLHKSRYDLLLLIKTSVDEK